MKYKALIFDIDNTLVNTLDMNMIPLQKIIREEKGGRMDFRRSLSLCLISRYEGHGRTRSQQSWRGLCKMG